MEPDAALEGTTRIVVLNSHSAKHAPCSIVHADRNRKVVLVHRRPEQFAGRAVESQAIGDPIKLCARHCEVVVTGNVAGVFTCRRNHLWPRVGAVNAGGVERGPRGGIRRPHGPRLAQSSPLGAPPSIRVVAKCRGNVRAACARHGCPRIGGRRSEMPFHFGTCVTF